MNNSTRPSMLVSGLCLLATAPVALHFAARLQAAEAPKAAPSKKAPPKAAPSKDAPPKIKPINAKAAAKISYSKQIKPLFEAKCIACHGNEDPAGELNMTTIEAMHKGGEEVGPSIIDGKPDSSPMVQYIRGLRKPRMPMRQKPLTEAELHLIRQWIQAGAKDN